MAISSKRVPRVTDRARTVSASQMPKSQTAEISRKDFDPYVGRIDLRATRPARGYGGHKGERIAAARWAKALRGFGPLPKRGLDLIASCILLILVAPLCAVIAAAIVFDSGFPILFRQPRRGLNGETFEILKFRTMRAGSDGSQARRGDCRTTRIGVLLRRSSLDELPQLLNVVKGEMSLVGPRPHPIWLDESFSPHLPTYPVRLLMLPGLTGLAQVNGQRGETPTVAEMARRLALDLEYIESWSFALDLKILLRTACSVWRDDRAS